MVEAIAQHLRILAIGAPLQEMEGGPLREVYIRIEGDIEDIQNLSLPKLRRSGGWTSTILILVGGMESLKVCCLQMEWW
ncbi:MAG: hypothetical protein GQ535_14425 [Rhodobacteraceae bacterium]|nr:hypothetical protein [Paracoccaceae bacterium]